MVVNYNGYNAKQLRKAKQSLELALLHETDEHNIKIYRSWLDAINTEMEARLFRKQNYLRRLNEQNKAWRIS